MVMKLTNNEKQQIILAVGKTYKTVSGIPAKITYRQPDDVEDAFPFVGHTIYANGYSSIDPIQKNGHSWATDGRSSDSYAFDITEDIL